MSLREFRRDLFTEIENWRQANFPNIKIIYENDSPIDESETMENAEPWMDVHLRFFGGKATSLGPSAPRRHMGSVSLSFYQRRGEGTADTDDLIDSFGKHFSSRRIGRGLLHTHEIAIATDFFGWYKSGLFIPLHFDE